MYITTLHAQLLPTPNRDALDLSSFFGYPLTFGDVTTNDWQILYYLCNDGKTKYS